MKVIVEPNKKMPIRGILSHPFIDPTRLELTSSQIKRVIIGGAKVYTESADGIKSLVTVSPDGDIILSSIACKEADDNEKEEIAKAEADAKRKAEEAERKAKEEAELKAKKEAEEKAEAERKAKEEADRKAKEEADRKAKEEAELKAKKEAEEKAKADKEAEELAEIEKMIAEEEVAKNNAETLEEE